MKLTLPGQMDMPAMPETKVALAKSIAAAPLKPIHYQLPCDIGLFSDEANQLDLIEMLMNPHE